MLKEPNTWLGSRMLSRSCKNSAKGTLGTTGFSSVRREVSVLAEGRHVFGRRPKPREKPLARSGAFYRPN